MLRRLRPRRPGHAVVVAYLALFAALGGTAFAAASWVCMLESGVEPVVVGLALGLITYAYPAARAAKLNPVEALRYE